MTNSPSESPDDGFVDVEALTEIIEKATDALRPLGLTVHGDVGMQADPKTGNAMLLFACILRPSARTKAHEDKASREAFNQMMAEQNAAMIEDKRKAIAEIIKGGIDESVFDDAENECEHKRLHPIDGWCLDCHFGMEDE
jgi:hypothetical protein